MMLKKTYQGLWLLFLALFSLGQLQRIQLSQQVALYGHDLVLALWLLLSFMTHFTAWKKSWRALSAKRLYLIFTLIFMAWISLGLGWSFIHHGFNLNSILFNLRLGTYLLTIFSLRFIRPFTQRQQQKFWLLTGLFVGLLGLLQYTFFPDTRALQFLGWDDHYYRLIGPLFDPNFTGLILVMTLLLSLSPRINRWLKRGALLILTPAIALTYSRATYLTLLGASLILFWKEIRSQQKLSTSFYGVVLLIFLSLPFLPRPGGEGVNLTRTYSVTSRAQNSQSALAQLKASEWLVGRGLFVPFETTQQRELTDTAHFPDNLLVFSLASTGVVGLALSLIVLGRWGLFLYEKDIFIFTVFIAVIIHSQVNHSLLQPFIFIYLWSLTQTIIKNET